MITVYFKDNCPACKMTERVLHSLGLSFKKEPLFIDNDPTRGLTKQAQALKERYELHQAPIVTTGHTVFCGFVPATLRTLAQTSFSGGTVQNAVKK